jgi:hypothetical protein
MQCSCRAWGSNSPLLGQFATLWSEPARQLDLPVATRWSARVAVANTALWSGRGWEACQSMLCLSACIHLATNSQSLDVDSVWSTGQDKWATGKLTLARVAHSHAQANVSSTHVSDSSVHRRACPLSPPPKWQDAHEPHKLQNPEADHLFLIANSELRVYNATHVPETGERRAHTCKRRT